MRTGQRKIPAAEAGDERNDKMIATLEKAPAGQAKLPEYLRTLTEGQRRLYRRIPETVDYVSHPCFTLPETEERLFGPGAPRIEVPAWTTFPQVHEEVITKRAAPARLRAKEEADLFLRYNYARCRLSELAKAQRKRRAAGRARQMVFWYQRAQAARSDLARANMPLVVSMAKRARIPSVEFADLVSEGNMALLRAVEKFDVSRGFKFSTYACRAILKSFNRLAGKTARYRRRFPMEFDPDLERSDYDVMKHDMQHQDALDSLGEVLSRNSANLTETERTVVMERFAIGSGKSRGRTLRQVGKMVGLTNERVRQIQKLAIAKLRVALDEKYLVA